MAASTRPLTLGEILDRTVQLYRRNFLLFAGISFPPSAIYVLVSGVWAIYLTSQMPALRTGTPNAPPNMQAMLAIGLASVGFLLLGIPILIAVSSVALSALNYAAFQTNRGDAVTIRSAYAYSFRRFWRQLGILFLQGLFALVIPGVAFAILFFILTMLTALLATTSAGKPLTILIVLLMFLLVIATMVVCIWIWLRLCLAFPVSVTEEKGAWPCIQRSNQLSKGSRGRIFVMYLMVVILTVIAYYALTLPLDIALKLTVYKSMDGFALLMRPPFALQVVYLFINCFERTFVLPIYAISLLLFYNDQRTRKEGYDIELLMANAGWANLPPAPVAPAYAPPAEAIYAPLAEATYAPPTAPPVAPAETVSTETLSPQTTPAQTEHPAAPPLDPSPEGTGA